MSLKRPTQKQIAEAVGLTQATVSLALSKHRSIPEATRLRVDAIARELGYEPDPYLSALSSYRKQAGSARFKGTLAWLSHTIEDVNWKNFPVFLGYHKGAVRRARELGYRIEEHELRKEADLSGRRLEQILHARGIMGILVPPQPLPESSIDFCFDKFSAVTFGYTLDKPRLNVAALSQFRSMEKAFRNLLELGYLRPGLAITDDSDRRADRNWSAAFWSEQRRLPVRQRVPLFISTNFTKEKFNDWFQRYKPDVVLSINSNVFRWLKELDLKIPEQVGFAMLSVPDEGKVISGIWENPELIGSKAVEFLIDMMHRREYGVPEVPVCLLVEGTWLKGTTVAVTRCPLVSA